MTRFKEKQTAPSLLSLLPPHRPLRMRPSLPPPAQGRPACTHLRTSRCFCQPLGARSHGAWPGLQSPPPISVRRGEGSRGRESRGWAEEGGGVTQYSSGTFSTGRPLRCCSQKRREQTHSLRACSSSTRYARACFSPSAVHLSSRSENRPRDLGKTGG